MAVPSAPTDAEGAKVLFMLYDDTGVNRAAMWRAVGVELLNGEAVAHLAVATHQDGDTFDAVDQVVAIAGVDSGVVRKMLVDAAGRLVGRPGLLYDSGGGAPAFATMLRLGVPAVGSEQGGHGAVGSHLQGDAFDATDPLSVAGGKRSDTGAVIALLADALGRLKVNPDATLAGTGAAKIAATGTAVPLKAATVPCRRVRVHAHHDNTGTIFLGISTATTARLAATAGYELRPGDSVEIEAADLTNVYINGTNVDADNDGVSFMWWT